MKAGYKYIFYKHLFVQGELGYSAFILFYNDQYGNAKSDTHGGFTYAPTIGANFGVFEIGLKYEQVVFNSDGAASNLSTAGLRFGFNF